MPRDKEKSILNIIEAIRNSFCGAETVFTKGSCYYFYEILKSIFIEAEAYYIDSHVVTKIDGVFYDINGIFKTDKAVPFVEIDEKIKKSIKNNKFGISGYYECPNCSDWIKIN